MQVAVRRRVQTDWAFATLEELKARRIESLNRATQAEGDALEPRRLVEVYSQAAADLGGRAVTLEAHAKAEAARGNLKLAQERHEEAESLRSLSDENWRRADEKAALATRLEGQARHESRVAEQLAHEIMSRTASFRSELDMGGGHR